MTGPRLRKCGKIQRCTATPCATSSSPIQIVGVQPALDLPGVLCLQPVIVESGQGIPSGRNPFARSCSSPVGPVIRSRSDAARRHPSEEWTDVCISKPQIPHQATIPIFRVRPKRRISLPESGKEASQTRTKNQVSACRIPGL